MEAQIREHHEQVSSSVLSFWCTQDYFGQFYQSECTCGLSLQAIGSILREKGYSPNTHRFFSWYSNLDIAVFSRALRGLNEIMDYTPFPELFFDPDSKGVNALQPVNIARSLIKKCTNLTSTKCGYVHRSMFPGQWLKMHLPENDTLAMNQICRRLLQESLEWL